MTSVADTIASATKTPIWFTKSLKTKEALEDGKQYLEVLVRAMYKVHDGYCSDFSEKRDDHTINVKTIIVYLPNADLSDFDWEGDSASWREKPDCTGSCFCDMWNEFSVINFTQITAKKFPIMY